MSELITVDLPAIPGWEASAHRFEPEDRQAIRAAELAGRPLLLRGEPGTGKTQFARAVAQERGYAFVYQAVTGMTELEALFWSYDAVDRLAEAQVLNLAAEADREALLTPGRFLSPGPLWWAFNWSSAEQHYTKHTRRKRGRPHAPVGPVKGVVLLLDEIDKADLDLPNGLLQAFGQQSFAVPWLEDELVSRDPDQELLIFVTSNDERELPRAFLRRCLVRELRYPDAALIDAWLAERARVHFGPDECGDGVLQSAAEMIREDRAEAQSDGMKPGLAEYLDLLRVLKGLHPGDESAQLAALDEVGRFVRNKQG